MTIRLQDLIFGEAVAEERQSIKDNCAGAASSKAKGRATDNSRGLTGAYSDAIPGACGNAAAGIPATLYRQAKDPEALATHPPPVPAVFLAQ